MGLGAELCVVKDRTIGGRILEQDAKGWRAEVISRKVTYDHSITERFGTGPHQVDGLGMTALVDEKGIGGRRTGLGATTEGHRFGGGGAFIKQRGICHIQASEIHDHRLEVEQGFEPPLRNLGLIGRVLCVPTGIFQDVAQNDPWRQGAIIAHADKRAVKFVRLRQGAHISQHIGFAAWPGQLQFAAHADRLGYGLVDEGIERIDPDDLDHAGNIQFAWPQMTMDELIQPP